MWSVLCTNNAFLATIKVDFPDMGKSYALFVQRMNQNLIPLFIMREAGLKVEEQDKIHVEEPAKENHSIYISDINLRISLQLVGIFLVFKTRNLNDKEIT